MVLEDERHAADDERVLHDAAEGLAGQRHAHAERRVHDGDAEHVERRRGRWRGGARLAWRAPKIETVMGMRG